MGNRGSTTSPKPEFDYTRRQTILSLNDIEKHNNDVKLADICLNHVIFAFNNGLESTKCNYDYTRDEFPDSIKIFNKRFEEACSKAGICHLIERTEYKSDHCLNFKFVKK